jgi:D-alanine-D-alanine ligase
VDFRVDADGAPLILEINANPCITPGAGFAAAAAQAGISYAELIDALVRAA